MNQVRHLDQRIFFNKYKVQKIDLVQKGLFSKKTVEKHRELDLFLSKNDRVNSYFSYLKFSLLNPSFISSFILPQLRLRATHLFSAKKVMNWESSNLIIMNNLKAGIARAFKPKNILEIGTYLGVGAAAFKVAIPGARVFTICPKNNKGANNSIGTKYIGYFFKKKRIDVEQIWADSMQLDYSRLPSINFSFIDGNHKYEYVYSDLKNTSAITNKAILVDDYIPPKEARKRNLVFGPWNDGVVRATDRFLRDNPNLFKEACWIKETKFCVLIK